MADVFDNKVPTSWRVDLWSLIRSTRGGPVFGLKRAIDEGVMVGPSARSLIDWLSPAESPKITPITL